MFGGYFQFLMLVMVIVIGGYQGYICVCCFRYVILLEDMQGLVEIFEFIEESRVLWDFLSSGGQLSIDGSFLGVKED